MKTIRLARPGDVDALLAIYAPYLSTTVTFEYVVPSREEFSRRIADVQARFPYLVLEEDGQIVGSGTVLPDGGTEAEIVAAFLIPESIGRGYGRKLFETLEADELAVKAERVWLTSSDMALGFYEHMGWVNPNGYRVRAGEENLLYMEKRK